MTSRPIADHDPGVDQEDDIAAERVGRAAQLADVKDAGRRAAQAAQDERTDADPGDRDTGPGSGALVAAHGPDVPPEPG